MKLKGFFAVSIPELEVSGFFSLLLLLSSNFGFDSFVNLGTEFHETSLLDGCLQAVLDHGLKNCCLPGTIYPDLFILLYTAQSPEMHRFREGQSRRVVA